MVTGARALLSAFGAALAALFAFAPSTLFAADKPRVTVEGNKAFSTRRVADQMPLPDPLPEWDREEWAGWAEDAALLIREAYRDQGYFDAQAAVRTVFADSSPLAPPALLRAGVFEGERYRFGNVRVGLPPPPFPAFTGELASRGGRVFDKKLLFADRRELLQFCGDAGFLNATAAESLSYDFDRKAVDVVFHVNPGRALVFDTLLFRIQREGDTTGLRGLTRPSVLRGLFPPEPGDTLSLRDINLFERKLKSTRVFNFVRVKDSLADPTAHTRSAVFLTAEERVPGEAEIAGYWETQYGFGADLSVNYGNLNGRLQEARLGLTLAQRKQSVNVGYSAPLLFGTTVRFDNDLISNWYQDSRLVRDTGWFDGDFDISNQSRLSRPITPWARAVGTAELFGKSERLDSVTRARDFNLNFLSSLYLQSMDNPINPSRGARLALTWGNGGPLLEAGELAVLQNRHNWLEAEAAVYRPLGGWAVAALRLDGGRFYGQGGINSGRFFLGGPRSVRSRDWRSVCPALSAEDNCLEEGIEPAYFLGSAELRLMPFQRATSGFLTHLAGLQIVPFADYGRVWQVGEAVNPSGEGRAVGLGLRYNFLTLFNIRIDYAQDPRDASVNHWFLDLAQAF